MDITHPCFTQPIDPNAKVWRYISTSKFINLIDSRKLFLPRANLLNDKHEGSIPALNYHLELSQAQTILSDKLKQEQFVKTMSDHRKAMMNTTYISCWHMNQIESAPMWKLYCGLTEGIAIQTTYEKLTQCEMYSNNNLLIGKVEYVHFENEIANLKSNSLAVFMHKHKTFEHEQEVRIISCPFNLNPEIEKPRGLLIDIELDYVIENIYVNSYAEDWYHDSIKSLVKKFNLNIPVLWSNFKAAIYI